MHHLVWIPRANLQSPTTAGRLSAVGLSDHAEGADTIQSEGPAGSGQLFAWRKNSLQPMHYNASEQTWIPAVKDGDRPEARYWVGVVNASPPTEEDLRRPGLLHGKSIELANGSKWTIPVPHALPHDLVLQSDGSLRHEPKERYQRISFEADRWRERLGAVPVGDEMRVSYEELYAFCVLCLSLNYRMPPELASHLRLIDTENVKHVIFAALRGTSPEEVAHG